MLNGFTIVCTDRGQHASAELAAFSPGDGGYIPTVWRNALATGEIRRRNKDDKVTRFDRADGGVTWHMRCPRCGREFRLRDDTLVKLSEVPVRVVDLSLSGM